ncbi:MAG TPA: hypothetical protein VNO32_16060, partial [Candidatus Acidoferrum sp.]|nr:hypothetical protein [Candidatus Acidoferrum sp.]
LRKKIKTHPDAGLHSLRHYAEFRTMPNWFLRIRRKQDESAGTPFRSSAPCGIVRDGSQVLEEA